MQIGFHVRTGINKVPEEIPRAGLKLLIHPYFQMKKEGISNLAINYSGGFKSLNLDSELVVDGGFDD
jgi:hypothetical protein